LSVRNGKSLQEGFGFSCGKPVVKIEPSRLYNREISALGIPYGTLPQKLLKWRV
jgi:hypothetical protein